MIIESKKVMEHERQCPVCGWLVFKPYCLGLLRCQSCELVLSPLIWEPQSNMQMEEKWFGEAYEARKTSVWVKYFEVWSNRATLARLNLAQLVPQGRRLLEIGVGSGSLLIAANKAGFSVMGCDLSPQLCLRIERQSGIKMHCGNLSDLDGEARFDIVVMNHVLEHVQQPVEFLQEVSRLLVPGGILHIAVPNIDCWEARLSGWTSYEPYHLTYFNPQILQKAITSVGFSIDQCFTCETFSSWFLAVVRTVLGVNRDHGAITRPFAKSVNCEYIYRTAIEEHAYRLAMIFFGLVSWPLRWQQGRLGFGDEVICLARKPTCLSES